MMEVMHTPTSSTEGGGSIRPIEVLNEAEVELASFKVTMENAFPKASALHEAAKWRWQDVHDLRHKKEHKAELAKMMAEQKETWDKLEEDAKVLSLHLDEAFAGVTIMQDQVKKARGVYPSVAALGFATPDQATARNVYAKKLKYAFQDAKEEHFKICGFPHGMLTQVRLLRQATEKMAC
jgi:septal ring factor EnvC (AmiA/AmiB activator)